MQILNPFLQQINTPNLTQTLKSAVNKLGMDLNCVRIGIVQEFYPDDITAKVQIASKKVISYNEDGSQTVREYAPIRAKVCYCNPYETFPLKQGDEVILLFNDREMESWFINGQSNFQKHMRMHDLTDCIAIAGIRSLPKMIQILTDCLHLFYGDSDIQIKNNEININSTFLNIVADTTQEGDISATGTISAPTLNATSAANGTFKTADSKTVTVVNGIITGIV